MDMTSLNVSLPRTLRDYVEQRISEGGYSTPSEYVRELIREDRERAAQERLETALLEGLASGEPKLVDQRFWARKRRDLKKRLASRTR